MLRRTLELTSLSLLLAFAASCAKDPPSLAPPPPIMPTAPTTPPKPAPPPPPTTPPPAPRALSEDELFKQKTLEQINAERPLADVYFDLDRSIIREDGRGPLTQNAAWLKRWSNTRVAIEGHCDERGTPEYNLGLGERRAAAVRDYLVGLGIAAERIAIVSKGKESPVCTDKTEACWQQNRRGHFIVTAK
jgi:peptidoglycan-associated lipoprotein